ncbi:hypothetical protein LCGC14_2275530 [marine sediment metagenome]|uniref:Uncharacterized protein n=1 Tax=marine sediment metagenome TaxID=412755 RepID=A0A0F9CVW5_9ZZZZ
MIIILYLIALFIVGMFVFKLMAYSFSWLERKQRRRDLREKYPSDHPFWKIPDGH